MTNPTDPRSLVETNGDLAVPNATRLTVADWQDLLGDVVDAYVELVEGETNISHNARAFIAHLPMLLLHPPVPSSSDETRPDCPNCNGRGALIDLGGAAHPCVECGGAGWLKVRRPSSSDEMPEWMREEVARMRTCVLDTKHLPQGSSADAIRWLASDRERLIRERDTLGAIVANISAIAMANGWNGAGSSGALANWIGSGFADIGRLIRREGEAVKEEREAIVRIAERLIGTACTCDPSGPVPLCRECWDACPVEDAIPDSDGGR